MPTDAPPPPVPEPLAHPAYEPPQPGPAIRATTAEEAATLPRELPPRDRDIERRERARLAGGREKAAPADHGHADVPPTPAPAPAAGSGPEVGPGVTPG